MPEGNQDHGLIALRSAIAAAAGDQLLDLAFGQVFAGSDIGVLGPARRDFPYFGGWGDDFQGWFGHDWQALRCLTFRKMLFIRKVTPFHCFFDQGNCRRGWPARLPSSN